MNPNLFYIAGNNAALRFASEYLAAAGCAVTSAPSSNVTHVLLPVPYPEGSSLWEDIADQLPGDVTVLGGNLPMQVFSGCQTADLLKDEIYLAENAAITADCAVRIAGNNLGVVFKDCPILILGWGRIGKCLARMLAALDADVTIAARKTQDRAIAQALCYSTTGFDGDFSRYRVIFNTAPAPVLAEAPDCVKIDLASRKGMAGDDVIWARGLPGKMLPKSSGKLIAETVLRLTETEVTQ